MMPQMAWNNFEGKKMTFKFPSLAVKLKTKIHIAFSPAPDPPPRSICQMEGTWDQVAVWTISTSGSEVMYPFVNWFYLTLHWLAFDDFWLSGVCHFGMKGRASVH